jgi:hypothetical protein
MGRILRFAALALLVVSCGSGNRPPANLDDACVIVRERKSWHRDMERVERRWGVPVAVQMATIYQESKFVHDARTPVRYVIGVIPMGRQSSAYGYAQAIDDTWDWYRSATNNYGARRDRFADAVDFMGWYMTETEKRNGISKSDARNQYLAYHEGHSGYARSSHNSKDWLVRIADTVGARATLYSAQLARCRR